VLPGEEFEREDRSPSKQPETVPLDTNETQATARLNQYLP
jgi:hypothetical protein